MKKLILVLEHNNSLVLDDAAKDALLVAAMRLGDSCEPYTATNYLIPDDWQPPSDPNHLIERYESSGGEEEE